MGRPKIRDDLKRSETIVITCRAGLKDRTTEAARLLERSVTNYIEWILTQVNEHVLDPDNRDRYLDKRGRSRMPDSILRPFELSVRPLPQDGRAS